MTAERWARIKEVFANAAERAGEARAAYLAEACGPDEELRREVESLLQQGSGSELRSPVHEADWVGRELAHFRILEKIGGGGMGVVYKASDLKLERFVALKFLPHEISAEEEYKRRFIHEAKAASALDHNNICTIHEIDETAEGQLFIAMAYYPGETLKKKIQRGPLPLAEALDYAMQVAQGLTKAHQQGIVHRDIKPANVMVTEDGVVKIVDFGLAQLGDATKLTKTGSTLGTLAYMSPEQVQRQPLDRRTDIWSLGVLLYEMVSGQVPFKGDVEGAVAYSILHEEPQPLTSLRTGVPIELERLVAKALVKGPTERYQHVDEMLVDLRALRGSLAAKKGPSGTTRPVAAPPGASRRKALPWIAAASLAVAALISVLFFGVFSGRRQIEEQRVFRFTVVPPEGTVVKSFSLSPDGNYLAFTAEEDEGARLWVHRLDAFEPRPVQGAEGVDPFGTPFWSPDSRFIGFFAEGKLRKVGIRGEPPVTLAEAPRGRGGTWNGDGVIIFTPVNHNRDAQIFRVSAQGGPVSRVTQLGDNSHRNPHFLPDGRRFLYFTRKTLAPADRGAYLGSLDSEESSLLFNSDSHAVFAAHKGTGAGYLLFVRAGVLLARPFDAEEAQFLGEAFPVVEGVGWDGLMHRGLFSVSPVGVLAYSTSNSPLPRKELVWFDRQGRSVGTVGPADYYLSPELSPDGKKAVVATVDLERNNSVTLIDLERGVGTVLTPGLEGGNSPVWSHDGRRIVLHHFVRGGDHGIGHRDAGGAGEVELILEGRGFPTSCSPDGNAILFQRVKEPGAKPDLMALPRDGKPIVFLDSEHAETYGRFSPDGRWVAYSSDESGTPEVFVRPFPEADAKFKISIDGGTRPLWRGDGKELFYLAADQILMSVDVDGTSAKFEARVPKPLFKIEIDPTQPNHRGYDVTSDGQRFLVPRALEETSPAPIHVVVNWTAELAARKDTR